MSMETSELDIEQQIEGCAGAAAQDTAVVHLRVPRAVALLHEQIGDSGIEQILRRQLRLMRLRAGLREGSLGAWSEDQRQAIGEAVSTKLAEMTGEDGSSPDWFDARHVDEVLDTIEQALRLKFAEHPEDNSPEAVIACLEDDAAGLREENPEDERAENMMRAAQLLRAAHPEGRVPGFVKPDTTAQVFFYEQDFYVLSNFSAFGLEWQGLTFPTSEHAYHWEKFATEADDQTRNGVAYEIMNARSAHDAFKLAGAQKHLRRPDWDAVKVGIMRDILRAKVQQHEYVRRKLLATGDRELIEDSWRDDFWGWGPNRDGQNMLGKLWMEIRAELRAEGARA